MSRENPCCHPCDVTDCDDPNEDALRDKGCCAPIPVKRTCLSPVLPVPECDEVPPEVVFDPETETFQLFSVLYDENCSAILDEDDSEIITQMG